MADPAICLMAVGAGADGSRLLISAIALSAHSPLEAGPAMSTAALGQFISSRSKDRWVILLLITAASAEQTLPAMVSRARWEIYQSPVAPQSPLQCFL